MGCDCPVKCRIRDAWSRQISTIEIAEADAFIKAHAPNGRTIARFPSPEPAFTRAFELCPGPS
jgi:hypothetical protein